MEEVGRGGAERRSFDSGCSLLLRCAPGTGVRSGCCGRMRPRRRPRDSERGAASGQVFHFPAGFVMPPGQVCRVYTDEVQPEWCGLSFGYRKSGVWNNNEPDAAVLFNGDGAVVSRWE